MKYIPYIVAIFLCISFAGCKKEYTVEIEEIEVWRGDVRKIGVETKKKTIKVKNDEEAANEAYLSYITSMKSCCHMEESGSAYLWIPVDYKIYDSDGNHVNRNLESMDSPYDMCITNKEDSIYYELLGDFKYAGTPYGIRNPKQSASWEE